MATCFSIFDHHLTILQELAKCRRKWSWTNLRSVPKFAWSTDENHRKRPSH